MNEEIIKEKELKIKIDGIFYSPVLMGKKIESIEIKTFNYYIFIYYSCVVM